MRAIAGVVVALFGLCLIGLAVMVAIRPRLAERFFGGFASSAWAHYLEQSARLVAGTGLVVFSPEMRYPGAFRLLGWLIVVTAVGLFLVPWTWHHRFARWAIPLAIRHMRLYALAALALGAFVLYSASRALLP